MQPEIYKDVINFFSECYLNSEEYNLTIDKVDAVLKKFIPIFVLLKKEDFKPIDEAISKLNTEIKKEIQQNISSWEALIAHMDSSHEFRDYFEEVFLSDAEQRKFISWLKKKLTPRLPELFRYSTNEAIFSYFKETIQANKSLTSPVVPGSFDATERAFSDISATKRKLLTERTIDISSPLLSQSNVLASAAAPASTPTSTQSSTSGSILSKGRTSSPASISTPSSVGFFNERNPLLPQEAQRAGEEVEEENRQSSCCSCLQ